MPYSDNGKDFRIDSGDILFRRGTRLRESADGTLAVTNEAGTAGTLSLGAQSLTETILAALLIDQVGAVSATVATTGNTDAYVIAPFAGVLSSADFSAVDALAQHGSNYVTFSVTNLGQTGSGTAAMLAATDANTSKTTTGTAISANTKRALTLTGTAADLVVAKGDRLLVRVAATGTLANTLTFPAFALRFTRTF